MHSKIDASKTHQVISNNSSFFKLDLMDFVFKYSENKWFVRIGIVAIILQFSIFKFLYPFAGFINGDSYVYLSTAYHNFSVNTYPIGYSMFLRLVSVFTKSDTFLVLLQYLWVELSALALVFTIFYFYKLGRLTKVLLFVFMVGNPASLYLANYIGSDAVFLSLSLTWFTMLIWIMNRPTNKLILINSVILFAAFTVRYNALFYPLICVVSLALTRRKVVMNIVGFALSLTLISFFVRTTTMKYRQLSGHSQFTPFTGWQIANNALCAYRYVDSIDRKAVPLELKELDRLVRIYFDSSRDVRTHPVESLMAGTVYMWSPNSPLSIYTENQFKNDTTATALKKWSAVAPTMKAYGSFLIKNYPNEYLKYYIVPNVVKYYVPPVEFLSQYSTGVDTVSEIAKVWFDYKSNKLKCYFGDFNVTVLDYYPILSATMNILFVLGVFSFVFLRGYRKNPQLMRGIVLVMSLWVVNLIFSVFASPIALRFQLFPIFITTIFSFLLMDFLIIEARQVPLPSTDQIDSVNEVSLEKSTT